MAALSVAPCSRLLAVVAGILVTSLAPARVDAQSPTLLHPPIGPYTNLQPADFAGAPSYAGGDRLVLTSYFYWYDVYSDAHILDSDGTDALTDHPPTLTGFSYRSVAWHKNQLQDMEAAGIDIALPVYWGEPSQRKAGRPVSEQPWSFAGIPPLIEARNQLIAEGAHPPRLGLFYDTSTLQYNAAGERIDLTTAHGREWFYETVRDFFSLVPPRHWAMIDGKPVIALYSAAFAAAQDQTCMDYLRTRFAEDFGGRVPFVIREISWNVATEQVYAWGGALGLKNPGVGSLGPGYDHSAVPGREPLVVPREDGAFFERNWLAFLRRPSRMVMLETWNEYHEGTDIAASKEYGRKYIDLCRKYVDLFKSGYQPPRLVGPYTDARLVEIRLGATNELSGLTQFEWADGATRAETLDGTPCRVTAPAEHAGHYMYFKVDDSFKWTDSMEVVVAVENHDDLRGTMLIEFDGSDTTAPFQGAYSPSTPVALNGSGRWRTSWFRLHGARFLNGQNGGADFRINAGAAGVAIRRVQVAREGLRALRFEPSSGFELQLFAMPGRTYAVETTSDLRSWDDLVELKPPALVSNYLDSTAREEARRWYRYRSMP